MRKRIYSTIAIVLSLASIAVATFVVAQKTASTRRAAKKSTSQRAPRRGAAARQRTATPPASPVRAADPNRAPQNLVDDALYTNEEFFGTQASVACRKILRWCKAR